MTKTSKRQHLFFADRKNLEEILRKALQTGPLIVDNSVLHPFLYPVNEETLQRDGKVGNTLGINNIVEYIKNYGGFNRQLEAARIIRTASRQVYNMYEELSQDPNFYLVCSKDKDGIYKGDYSSWEISIIANLWNDLSDDAHGMRLKRKNNPDSAARKTAQILNECFKENRYAVHNIVKNTKRGNRVILPITFFEGESYLDELLWSEIHDKRFSAKYLSRMTMFFAWIMSREFGERVFIETRNGSYLGMVHYTEREKEEVVGKCHTGALPEVVVIFDRPSRFPISVLPDYYPKFMGSYECDPVRTEIPNEMFNPKLPILLD